MGHNRLLVVNQGVLLYQSQLERAVHASFMKFMMTGEGDDDISLNEIFQTNDTFQYFCTTGSGSVTFWDGRRFCGRGFWIFFTSPFPFGEGFDDG
jgi:hypothetical protein